MDWTLSLLSVVVFAGGGVSLLVGIAAFRQRPDLMSWPLATLMFLTAAWAFPSAVGFGFTDSQRVIYWFQLEILGLAFVPLAYLVMALVYAGYHDRLTPAILGALALPPTLTVVVIWTNELHVLYWQSVTLESVGAASILSIEPGPWVLVQFGYSYLYILASFVVLGGVVLRAGTVHRKQALLMFLGGTLPTAVNVVIALEYGVGIASELIATLTALSGGIYWIALFRTDVLNLSPAAYQNVPDTFGDGLLVFDAEYRLVMANDHAKRMLTATVEPETAAQELFGVNPAELDSSVISAAHNRYCRLRHESLHDHRDAVVGHAVTVRDITEYREQQQQIEVLNRILRHNIRNEVNKAIGWLDMLETNSADIDQETLQTVRESMTTLERMSEKARAVEFSHPVDRASFVPIDTAGRIRQVTSKIRNRYPHATIQLDLETDAPVRAAIDEFETILENLLENAIVHHDREQPIVTVRTDVTAETVSIRITDDGPGIPPTEWELLGETETPLAHTSGLGLWLVYWLVTGMGGKIEFESPSEPTATHRSDQPTQQLVSSPATRGTVVIVHLQRASDPAKT